MYVQSVLKAAYSYVFYIEVVCNSNNSKSHQSVMFGDSVWVHYRQVLPINTELGTSSGTSSEPWLPVEKHPRLK